MPTLKQRLVAKLARLYPFYSGCGTVGNHPFLQRLAGESSEQVWARTPGGELLCSLTEHVGRSAYYTGDLDRKVTWICKRIVRPGDTVLDIGANVGLVTLWLSSLVGESGSVHAFEPNPELRACLEKSIQKNGYQNIKLHPVALGDEEGFSELSVPESNTGQGSLIRHHEDTEHKTFKVPVRTLSTLLEEEKITDIRFIKLDVEGFEEQVLEGARDGILQIQPQAILFEINDVKHSPSGKRIFSLLSDLDYRFLAVPKSFVKMRLIPFDPELGNIPQANDFIALLKGEPYEQIGRLLNIKS